MLSILIHLMSKINLEIYLFSGWTWHCCPFAIVVVYGSIYLFIPRNTTWLCTNAICVTSNTLVTLRWTKLQTSADSRKFSSRKGLMERRPDLRYENELPVWWAYCFRIVFKYWYLASSKGSYSIQAVCNILCLSFARNLDFEYWMHVYDKPFYPMHENYVVWTRLRIR